MRRFAIIAVVAVAVLLVAGWLLLPTLNWDGAVPRKLQLTVLDEATSGPISGATVKFGERDVGTTDAAGKCEWTGMFPAGGTSGLFGRSGEWLVYGELAVAAPDGRARSVRLDELVKDSRRSLRNDDPIELSIPLAAPAASHNPALQRTGAASRSP
jgi:hypothetical protein